MRKFPKKQRRVKASGVVWLAAWSQRRRRTRMVVVGVLLTEGGDVLVTESGDELRKESDE